MEGPVIQRVLIANRGEVARRLIRYFRERDIETVAVFSEPDAEHPWVEEADYACYLDGVTVPETYLDARKVVSAAMDSGADGVHPGYCFLADRSEFYEITELANLFTFGAGSRLLARVGDRMTVREIARALGLDVVPGTDVIGQDDDVIAEALQVGFPLFVKARHSSLCERVEDVSAVDAAVQRVREMSGGDVFLERSIERLRYLSVAVVGDDEVGSVPLGIVDSSVRLKQQTWIEEMHTNVVPGELGLAIQGASVAIADQLNWRGIGRVRWALSGETPYLIGFTPRLPTGYSLTGAVHGLDLIDIQHRTLTGEHLGWGTLDTQPTRAGIQFRVLHGRPGEDKPHAQVGEVRWPEGDDILVEAGIESGVTLGPHTEPILAKVTVLAPNRELAVLRARRALAAVSIEGVETNLAALRAVFEDEAWRAGDIDLHTLPRILG